jgi:hypothetical protein
MKKYRSLIIYWIPYLIGLTTLLIVPYKINMFEEGDILLFGMFYIVFPLALAIALYGTIKSYKYDTSLLFKRLSVLPWVLVISHALLLYLGDIYSQEGGHWVLYGLIIVSTISSFLLYMIGVIIKVLKRTAV